MRSSGAARTCRLAGRLPLDRNPFRRPLMDLGAGHTQHVEIPKLRDEVLWQTLRRHRPVATFAGVRCFGSSA